MTAAGYSARTLAWARELADLPYWEKDRAEMAEHLARVIAERRARPVSSGMLDPELCVLAEQRADLMAERIGGMADAMTDEAMRQTLSAWLVSLDAKALPGFACGAHPAEQLMGWIKRATCRLWWRRQLRRAAVRLREAEGQAAGEICIRRQVYCTDDTVARRSAADKRNRAMLEAAEIEDAAGEVLTLWDAVEASTSNPALRRAELMTRIRGCEEWADRAGFVGLFTTNTAPSRFHPQLASGGSNPRHDPGLGPRDAQAWLSATWSKARAALHRRGVRVFGLRVAEPHHDGCPHWHMLLWCEPQHLQQLQDVLRAYWLKDAGDELGAERYRFNAKRLEAGGAAGYVAKYVAKNIDDAGAVGVEGHTDDTEDGPRKVDGKAARVRAWASAHGIRQFQTIGQPPVTVWRELRRVEASAVAGASQRVQAAHAAVHRAGGRRACWLAYMDAQGGPLVGRGYMIRLATEQREREGRYELVTEARPVGVQDVERPGAYVRSSRREWKPRGTWTPEQRRDALFGAERQVLTQRPQGVASPWTRFNNCTRRAAAPAELMRAGIVGASWKERNRGVSSSTKDRHGPQETPDRR